MEELFCINEEKVPKDIKSKLHFKSKRYFLKDLFKNCEDDTFQQQESTFSAKETPDINN